MAISKGELSGKILRLLHKTASNPGFYTADKIGDAIEEAVDYVAMQMFDADEGWQTKLWYPSGLQDGQITVDLSEDVAMIKAVRFKVGDIYVPMVYDPGNDSASASTTTAARQSGNVYKIIDNALYFNPPLSLDASVVKPIEVEHLAFPQRMVDDQDFLEAHFNKAMQHFIKYKAASILSSSIEKFSRPWAAEEAQWFHEMQKMVVKRNQQSVAIRSFE